MQVDNVGLPEGGQLRYVNPGVGQRNAEQVLTAEAVGHKNHQALQQKGRPAVQTASGGEYVGLVAAFVHDKHLRFNTFGAECVSKPFCRYGRASGVFGSIDNEYAHEAMKENGGGVWSAHAAGVVVPPMRIELISTV